MWDNGAKTQPRQNTAMVFDTVPSKILSKCGEKDILVRTTGGEKKRFTAVLAINTAGGFLRSSRANEILRTSRYHGDGLSVTATRPGCEKMS